MSIKSAWTIFKRILNSFSRDRVMTLSAALAYYAMFSIAPLLVLAIGVAGLVFGDQAAQHQLAGQIQGFVGPKAARVIESMMAAQEKSGSLIATIVGIVLMFLGASGIFAQLKDSLNVIWGVEPKADRGIFGVLFDRLFALLLVLLIGVLLLASMLLTTAISAFYGALEQVVPVPSFVLQVLNLCLSLAIVTLLFAIIFKVLPDVRIPWRNVWIGAFGTALLFTIGEFGLSLYLGQQSVASTYGAAGSVVVILLWIYYSSVILLVGAEFTQVLAERAGAQINPGKFALRIRKPQPSEAAPAEPKKDQPRITPRPAEQEPARKRASFPPSGRPRPQEI